MPVEIAVAVADSPVVFDFRVEVAYPARTSARDCALCAVQPEVREHRPPACAVYDAPFGRPAAYLVPVFVCHAHAAVVCESCPSHWPDADIERRVQVRAAVDLEGGAHQNPTPVGPCHHVNPVAFLADVLPYRVDEMPAHGRHRDSALEVYVLGNY